MNVEELRDMRALSMRTVDPVRAWDITNNALANAITELTARDREIAELRDRADGLDELLYGAESNLARKSTENYSLRERADRAETEAREYRYKMIIAEEERDSYTFLFDLANKRTSEATAAWRDATGQHNVTPDLGMLLEWLLNRIDELEANLAVAEYDNLYREHTQEES